MDSAELLIECFTRIRDLVPATVDGLSDRQLNARPGGTGNSIGWLVWHLSRVQDDHVSDVAGEQQVWLSDGWRERFGLDLAGDDIGYGHSSTQVDTVRVSTELLLGYHAAVADRSEHFIRGVGADDLDRVVDERWDPPVTMGARLVSVLSDCLQHLGQAAYVRGLPG